MSKFLSLVEENTPGKEQPESLADKFHRFADRVSALEEGRDIDIDELLLELNALNEELTTKGGVPEAEDFETPAGMKKRLSKIENDKSMIGNATKALHAGKEVKAAADPKRPSRGVKKIDKSIDKMATAISKSMDRVTKSLK
jgi:hypothetical protein